MTEEKHSDSTDKERSSPIHTEGQKSTASVNTEQGAIVAVSGAQVKESISVKDDEKSMKDDADQEGLTDEENHVCIEAEEEGKAALLQLEAEEEQRAVRFQSFKEMRLGIEVQDSAKKLRVRLNAAAPNLKMEFIVQQKKITSAQVLVSARVC